jgi:hypothetical protein
MSKQPKLDGGPPSDEPIEAGLMLFRPHPSPVSTERSSTGAACAWIVILPARLPHQRAEYVEPCSAPFAPCARQDRRSIRTRVCGALDSSGSTPLL